MKKILYPLLLLLFVVSCKKDSNLADQQLESNTTPDSVEIDKVITGIIDKDINLEGAKVLCLYDSALVENGKFELRVPEKSLAKIFITDQYGDKVLALASIKSDVPTVNMDVKSICFELLSILPEYSSLSESEKSAINSPKFTSLKAFCNLSSIVSKILKVKGDLYAEDNDKLQNAIAANVPDVLAFQATDVQKAKTSLIKTQATDPRDVPVMNSWLSEDDGSLKLINTNRIYTQASFDLIYGSPSNLENKFIMNPMEDVKINLDDDYYKVSLTQGTENIRLKNRTLLATTSVNILLGAIIDVGTPEVKDCLSDLTDEVTKQVLGYTIKGGTKEEAAINFIEASAAVAKTYLDNSNCPIPKGKILGKIPVKLVVFSGKVFLKVLDIRSNLIDATTILSAIGTLILPMNLSENIQIYYGSLIKATVGFGKENEIGEARPGETVNPIIGLAALTSYDTWDKSGFEVQWELKSGGGTLNTSSSKTGDDGKAEVFWTLPANASGIYDLIANIKDKEGDHLEGSPQTFQVAVKGSLLPKSISVNLTGGDASNIFMLPAALSASSFGNAMSVFRGSNNKSETGSPLFSSAVEQGATYYPINVVGGFPPRINTSDPRPNRTGSSSFIAIKTDDKGGMKIWINMSIGAFRVTPGGGTLDWEYQFRYFQDSQTGNTTSTLGTVTNSGAFSGQNVQAKVQVAF